MSGFVHIPANRKRGAVYTGVTADLPRRVLQHREGTGSKFCAKYGISRLVHVEEHDEIGGAITREKHVKKWNRAWKIELIEKNNPDWRDLFFDLYR